MNKAILQGNLGKDPELRTIESGKSVASFPLATNESYTNKSGEKVNITDWHNCVVWGAKADVIAKYVSKGDNILLEGKIKSRSYETKDGDKKYVTEIVVDNFEFLSKVQNQTTSEEKPPPPDETDDLPF